MFPGSNIIIVLRLISGSRRWEHSETLERETSQHRHTFLKV